MIEEYYSNNNKIYYFSPYNDSSKEIIINHKINNDISNSFFKSIGSKYLLKQVNEEKGMLKIISYSEKGSKIEFEIINKNNYKIYLTNSSQIAYLIDNDMIYYLKLI